MKELREIQQTDDQIVIEEEKRVSFKEFII